MKDEPMTLEEIEAEAAQTAFDNWKADESERRYYRQREIDHFLTWMRDELPSLTRRDESAGYEAYHERRLALNLSEEDVAIERQNFIARSENPMVCDLF